MGRPVRACSHSARTSVMTGMRGGPEMASLVLPLLASDVRRRQPSQQHNRPPSKDAGIAGTEVNSTLPLLHRLSVVSAAGDKTFDTAPASRPGASLTASH